jgi:hypothetical protein
MKTHSLFFLSFVAFAGCGAPEDVADHDVVESDQISDEGKEDSLNSTSTYYTVRPDLRRCAYPMCGGAWVKRANQTWTQCADGSWANECYVAEINLSALKLSAVQEQETKALEGRLVLRGKLVKKTIATIKTAEFKASEAWTASSDQAATGIFYRVKDSGVRCFTFPCPSYHEAKLNSTVSRTVHALDLSQTGAGEEAEGNGYTATTEPSGLLVAGKHTTITGPAGKGLALVASQFYIKVTAKSCSPILCALYCEYGFKKDANGCSVCSCNEPPVKKCYVGGCSGQLCSETEGLISTCEWQPQYACYKTATCEAQADGSCGWTPTAELKACLANP